VATNEEKRKNRHLVTYCEKSEKNVKILQVFPQFFEFFGILGQKRKHLRKNKKDVFFRFPLKARGGCLIWATLYVGRGSAKIIYDKKSESIFV
jgi:hypothetical protein